jgi:hypothetical protein
MVRFVVVESVGSGHLLGLLDSYGKCHLARIAMTAAVTVGCVLHGPRAAVGLHFLASGQTGQRLSTHFQAVGLGRQALIDELHRVALREPHQAIGPAWPTSQRPPRRVHGTPARTVVAQQSGSEVLLWAGHVLGEDHPTPGSQLAPDVPPEAAVVRRIG